ncbi:MAG: hypothetical protein ABDI19_05540 [Armatimonadota bacterium]
MSRQIAYESMSAYKPRLPSNNAYDYYISAARQLKSSKAFTGNQPPTHEEVRWIERNQGAFNTLRQGCNRRYHWPFAETSMWFLFDELARLRELARLVNTRIRWAIAAKDGMDAVNDWRIGFKMASDIQGDLILVYLVGVAIESVVHAPIIREMDFFSAHECRELARTLIESERTPDRIGTVVEGELKLALRTMDSLLTEQGINLEDLDLVGGLIPSSEESDPETQRTAERLRQEIQRLQKQPAAYQQLRHNLRREISHAFQAFADSLTLQGGRYRPMLAKEYDTNTLFGYLMETLVPTLPGIAQRYWETRTRRRLMIAHLLLREYYLREGRYPASLDELNLQELAIDPFSGRPLIYRRTGDRYQLYSVGSDGKDDGGHNPEPGPGAEPPRDLFLVRGGWR